MTSTTLPPTVLHLLGLGAAIFSLLSMASFTVREPLYESLAGTASRHPELHPMVDLIASKGLLALVAITAVIAIIAWHRGRESFLLLVAAGAGTVAAYASSEVVKLLVEQQRPCRDLAVETVMACPAAGDWSWPSNHATIAAALATSCVLIVPRIWPLVGAIAVLIGLSRVLGGVHYVHDVAAGLAVGIVVTLVVTVIAQRSVIRLLAALGRPTSSPRRSTHR